MKVIEWVDRMKAEGIADFFCVYANIGHNSDEMMACEPCEASDCEVIDTLFIEGYCGITAVVTAVA